ncbi:MAG: glycosyltransferase [Propioniciclava sp.]|uniref:glycosyltransferase n=1 Tax=Propioniciclava sp. TaxID=2038686 RepID=UPI0039E64A0D
MSATPVLNVFAARAALAGTRTVLAADWLEVWTPGQWREYSGPLVGRVANLLQALAIRLSPLATGHSRRTQDGILGSGLPAGRFLRSPGLVPEMDQVTPRLGVAAEPGPVLFVGRHIQDKRVETIPPALALARRDQPGLRAVIGGSGPETDAVKRAARAAGVEDAVSFPGFVAEDELARMMGEASCLLNPSRREGYGLVVVEAAAHGTPSIVTAHPANASTELIAEGVNGFVAASASPEDLAEAIGRVHAGGEALRRSTRAWYEDAIRTRTIARTAQGILDALEKRRR